MFIHKLRVSRAVAGKTLPFDLLYLVNFKDKEHIENMFGYSIVMPLKNETLAMFEELAIHKHVTQPHERGESTKEFHRTPEAGYPTLKTLLDLDNERWLCVVPLLPRSKKNGEGMRHPAYLTARKWKLADNTVNVVGASARKRFSRAVAKKIAQETPIDRGGNNAFNDQAYLQTPEKAVRPPCLLCPRYILHTQGECQLGDLECFGHLPLGLQEIATTTTDDTEDAE